jgi:hypothetical protein
MFEVGGRVNRKAVSIEFPTNQIVQKVSNSICILESLIHFLDIGIFLFSSRQRASEKALKIG